MPGQWPRQIPAARAWGIEKGRRRSPCDLGPAARCDLPSPLGESMLSAGPPEPAQPVPASSVAHWRQKYFFHQWFKEYDS